MNQSINNDMRNNANNLKNTMQNEVNNISKTSIVMGQNIRDTARNTALKAEQLSRNMWSRAEGLANDTRIRAQNKANELQEQVTSKANELQQQATTKANELQQQAMDTATDLKEQAEVAVGIRKEEGWFKNPLQFFKIPTLSNITNKLSPKNLFCGNPIASSQQSINSAIDQFGGSNGKKAIIELLQYNLIKREKILNILFEDLMIFVVKGKKVPKKKEKKVLKLIQEIDLINKKLKKINQTIPIVKKNKLGAKRIKYASANKSRKKKKTKNRKTKNKKRRKKNTTKRRTK